MGTGKSKKQSGLPAVTEIGTGYGRWVSHATPGATWEFRGRPGEQDGTEKICHRNASRGAISAEFRFNFGTPVQEKFSTGTRPQVKKIPPPMGRSVRGNLCGENKKNKGLSFFCF